MIDARIDIKGRHRLALRLLPSLLTSNAKNNHEEFFREFIPLYNRGWSKSEQRKTIPVSSYVKEELVKLVSFREISEF